MLKKVLVLAALAGALGGVATPALAAGQLCVTTDINVAGTAAPTNGTNSAERTPVLFSVQRKIAESRVSLAQRKGASNRKLPKE